MNILGHCLIALNMDNADRTLITRIGADNADDYERDLIIGALLPESCPFIADNPFSFDEIHEGGEVILKFLQEKYPARIGLALGMLSHSVKFGADSFNPVIETLVDGGQCTVSGGSSCKTKDEVLAKIREAVGADEKTSKGLLHNFLWAGVDFWIFEKNKELIPLIQRAIMTLSIADTADMLAECFGKNKEKSRRMVETLFKKLYQPEDLFSQEGLVRTWLRQSEELKFERNINFEKTMELIKECQELMKNEWEKLLGEVRKSVNDRMVKL